MQAQEQVEQRGGGPGLEDKNDVGDDDRQQDRAPFRMAAPDASDNLEADVESNYYCPLCFIAEAGPSRGNT